MSALNNHIFKIMFNFRIEYDNYMKPKCICYFFADTTASSIITRLIHFIMNNPKNDLPILWLTFKIIL